MKALKSRRLTQKVEEWSEENSRVELEVSKLTFNFILLSHTFELWVTETCVCPGCFNPRGPCWSVIFTNAELERNIITIHAGGNLAKYAKLCNKCQYFVPVVLQTGYTMFLSDIKMIPQSNNNTLNQQSIDNESR